MALPASHTVPSDSCPYPPSSPCLWPHQPVQHRAYWPFASLTLWERSHRPWSPDPGALGSVLLPSTLMPCPSRSLLFPSLPSISCPRHGQEPEHEALCAFTHIPRGSDCHSGTAGDRWLEPHSTAETLWAASPLPINACPSPARESNAHLPSRNWPSCLGRRQGSLQHGL